METKRRRKKGGSNRRNNTLTDPDDVSFDFFKSDKNKYKVGEYTHLSGKINKGGLYGIKVEITVTGPNKTEVLKLIVTEDGNFGAPHPLRDAGTYQAQAKYLKAESEEISFDVE